MTEAGRKKTTFFSFFFFFLSEIKSIKLFKVLLLSFAYSFLLFLNCVSVDTGIGRSFKKFFSFFSSDDEVCHSHISRQSCSLSSVLHIQLFILLTTYRRSICLLSKLRILFLQKEEDKGKKGLVDPYMEFSFCGKKVTDSQYPLLTLTLLQRYSPPTPALHHYYNPHNHQCPPLLLVSSSNRTATTTSFSTPLPATVASSIPTRKDKVLLFFLPWQAFYTCIAAEQFCKCYC